jgi:solute carrier family 25 aspartate/glutamate transporter 12/13
MASTTAALKESVKETLLGVEDEPQLSSQMRAEFMQHAKTDPESGDHYMGQEEFVNAIAPESEDYVRIPLLRPSVLVPMLTSTSTKSSAPNMQFSFPSPTAARLVV